MDEPISIYCEFQYEGDIVFQEYWPQVLAGRDVLCYTLFERGTWESYKAGARIKLIDYTSDALLISEEFSDTMRILPELPLEQKLKELFKTLVISDAEGRVLLTLEDFSKARVEVGPNGVPTTSSSETICTSKKLLEPRHDDVHGAVACSCVEGKGGATVFWSILANIGKLW